MLRAPSKKQSATPPRSTDCYVDSRIKEVEEGETKTTKQFFPVFIQWFLFVTPFPSPRGSPFLSEKKTGKEDEMQMTPLANGLFTVLLVSAAVFAGGDRPTTSTHWVLSDTGELKTGDLSEIYRLPADVPRYVLQHFQLLRMTCCPADGI